MFLPPPTRATILDLQLMVSQSSGRRVRELKSGILHSLTRTNLQQWKGDFKSYKDCIGVEYLKGRVRIGHFILVLSSSQSVSFTVRTN